MEQRLERELETILFQNDRLTASQLVEDYKLQKKSADEELQIKKLESKARLAKKLQLRREQKQAKAKLKTDEQDTINKEDLPLPPTLSRPGLRHLTSTHLTSPEVT